MHVLKFAVRVVAVALLFWVAFEPIGYTQAPAPAPG